MLAADRRQRFRKHLAEPRCIQPASIFDAVSARIADALGFEVGMLAGSVASAVAIGAPDLTVLTLSELAEQCRRITRASDLSLLVDADHGYGNALNVMRTVEELEHAEVSAFTIEDTALPAPYGQPGEHQLIPLPEMVGKLRAALEARSDPSLVIIARTRAVQLEGPDEAIARVRAYTDTGVDAIFGVGVTSREQLEAVHGATPLPLLLGRTSPALDDRDYLASMGVRVALRGHLPFQVAIKAVYEALKHQKDGGLPEGLREGAASPELMAEVLREETYARWQGEFLGIT